MRGKPGSCGARGVQLASRRAKEAAGSQSPARVPCVQRQKMVSERPGLLLVPHTSSISSLVSSDMMGYRRAGLRFQDSCPGTWGKGRLRRQELRDGGGERAGRLDARKTKGDRATCRDRASSLTISIVCRHFLDFLPIHRVIFGF